MESNPIPAEVARRRSAFENIYRAHEWGGQSRSGPGSDQEHTVAYVGFVNDWLSRHPSCHDIVEIGCGDWTTTRLLHLTSSQTYTGYDIVPEVIARNVEAYQTDTVRFECADFLVEKPKVGDLLIIKDVLQHLSNTSVMFFINEVLPRYRYALIVNDVCKYEERKFLGMPIGWREIQAVNVDVVDGGSRPIRLDSAPFNLPVEERYSYRVTLRTKPKKVVYVKDVLVWTR